MSDTAAHKIQAPQVESDDAFLGGRLRIFQPGNGYRAGVDGVLLAATVQASAGTRVLDVGAGVGVVGLCIAHRLAGVHVTLIERDARLAALARRNVERNGFGASARVIEADILQPLGATPELAAAAESFDHVVSNPPFLVEGRGSISRDPIKARANAMPEGALDRWARFMAAMLRPGGRIGMIHRAEALPEILPALAGRFGGVVILPLHARAGHPAFRVLVAAVKGSRAPMELQPGLVLHDADGSFQPRIEAVLRDGAELLLRRDPSYNA
jgi:tRNA1(Val) A37 N6-methylase TrmN6